MEPQLGEVWLDEDGQRGMIRERHWAAEGGLTVAWVSDDDAGAEMERLEAAVTGMVSGTALAADPVRLPAAEFMARFRRDAPDEWKAEG